MVVIKIDGNIKTTFSGYNKLLNFYNTCRAYTNETISVDFYDLLWIDSNLCSLLDAIFHKLEKENNLIFSTDFKYLLQTHEILFRNGFIKNSPFADDRKSTVRCKCFEYTESDEFCEYIDSDLLEHRGITIPNDFKEKISYDLCEIFGNSAFHANSKEPFYVAGQFYPKEQVLRFTMVDLGDGFLPKINSYTNGEINNSIAAIQWAIAGNSSKEDEPGGLGLSGIYKYFSTNKGVIDILSSGGFWSSGDKETIFANGRQFSDYEFVGTTISLTFHK